MAFSSAKYKKISTVYNGIYLSIINDHQTWHLSTGFMGLPLGQRKAELNSGMLDMSPITLKDPNQERKKKGEQDNTKGEICPLETASELAKCDWLHTNGYYVTNLSKWFLCVGKKGLTSLHFVHNILHSWDIWGFAHPLFKTFPSRNQAFVSNGHGNQHVYLLSQYSEIWEY